MIRHICTDQIFLSMPSTKATELDLQVAIDLAETLAAHSDRCVGMAANMIGVNKRIIAFPDESGSVRIMFNPEIVEREGEYQTEEGCLSLIGQRTCTRYERIKVSFQDTTMQAHTEEFEGFVAEVIQHETDHCNGILI